ncbi:hypothetical protein GCM10027570_16350 [Streptomonospora sediminis]
MTHLADWRPYADEPYYDPEQVWAVAGVGRWNGGPTTTAAGRSGDTG